jgi:hypothetical protein
MVMNALELESPDERGSVLRDFTRSPTLSGAKSRARRRATAAAYVAPCEPLGQFSY